MAIPKHLLDGLEKRVAQGDYERAAKLARELMVGAKTEMDRKVIKDYARRNNLETN